MFCTWLFGWFSFCLGSLDCVGWFALVSDLGVKVAGFANLPGLHWFVAQLVLSQVGGQVDRFAYT